MPADANKPPADLIQRLKELRIRHYGPRGKRRFAAALGIPLSTYCTYETDRQPPPALLVKVAELTGCDLNWLLTGDLAYRRTPALDPDEQAIVQRLARLIAGRPEARQAVEALADLLAEGRQARQQPNPHPQPSNRAIPVIGRAAAGKIAFWPNVVDAEDLPDLAQLAHQASDRSAGHLIPSECLSSPLPEPHQADVTIVELADPLQMGHLPVDGVILTKNSTWNLKSVAVRIDGDSMADLLRDGDYVIADPEQPPAAGQPALVMVAGQIGATCKVYIDDGDTVRLVSHNEAYPSTIVRKDHIRFAWRILAAVRRKKP